MRTHICFTSITIIGLLFAAGCSSINDGTSGNTNLSDSDMEMAGSIMGEALSDETDGVVASIYDATSQPGTGEMDYTPFSTTALNKGVESVSSFGQGHRNRGGRGMEHNYQAVYDPETGIHTISFERVISNPAMEKTMEAYLTYLYRDTSGNFLEFPKLEQGRVASLDYTGLRTGTHSGKFGEGSFTKKDTMYYEGLSPSSAYLTFSGVHLGTGEMMRTPRGLENTIERNYEVYLRYSDISLDKALVKENGSLEEGVTGTMSYTIDMYKNTNGDEDTIHLEGTIELTGDGTALMNFKGHAARFVINLVDGTTHKGNNNMRRNNMSHNHNNSHGQGNGQNNNGGGNGNIGNGK